MMALHNGIWYETCPTCKGKGVETDGTIMTICGECDGDCYIPHEHQPESDDYE